MKAKHFVARIHRLDPSLVNQIAAGEVIERPASVVKELVENALDAGAGRIDITIEEGGSKLIRVSDNGCGIAGEDLDLAVASHATSKISTSDDLFRISTLGFRGEALASIGSVSHLRIVSRTEQQLEAFEILSRDCSEGARSDTNAFSQPKACSGPVGTSVEVRNLFYNVPARRKFLRHASTELAHITEQVARAALAHPDTAFSLTHNGRILRNLPATSDRRGRIADFYGGDLAMCLLPVSTRERGLSIEALIAPPAQSRPSTKWQYLFVNGRFISDRRIAFAVREAYRGLVEHDRYPVVFIFLDVPADSFDVNVHPTKIEVRWRDAGLIQSQVLAVIRETLLGSDLTPKLGLQRAGERFSADESRMSEADTQMLSAFGDPGAAGAGESNSARFHGARQALADYLRAIDPTQARLTFRPPPFPTDALRPTLRATISSPPEAVARREETEPTSNGDAAAHQMQSQAPLQVHNTYIVAETDEGLVIIDQHALHERILFERFKQRVLAGALESQRLLVPATIEASPGQTQAASAHAALLGRLGIEVSSFGPQTLAVQSFPTLLSQLDPGVFTSDLLDRLSEPEAGDVAMDQGERLLHKCLDMMACKAAVKAGDPLTQEEMQALLLQRELTQRSSNCPHGRPTTLELSTRDLEKQFKRI